MTKGYGQVYGYARVSTAKQKLDRQIKSIKEYNSTALIFTEAYTGTTTEKRDVFNKLIERVKKGDTIVFDSVSRMSRNAEEGTKIYFDLYDRGVNLVFLNEHYIDTSTYRKALESHTESLHIDIEDKATGKLVNTILDALNEFQKDLAKQQIQIAFDQAEKEVKDIQKRVKDGLATRRINTGLVNGRAEGTHIETDKAKINKAKILKMSKDFGGNMDDNEIYGKDGLHICRNTYFKYKRELKEELRRQAEESAPIK